MATDGGSVPRRISRQPGVGTVCHRRSDTNMRIVVTLPVASCYVAWASGNVNAVTADLLTCEGTAHNRASIPIEAKMTVRQDRKSTRLNSSHRCISYDVFCLK